jgi:uncharacterized protein YerC
MTKISKVPLRTDVWERVFKLFVETLASQRDRKKVENFIEDFFSPTEKIMLAKRLALAVLIAKDNDYESIRGVLRISHPTIAKMSLKIKYGGDGLKPVLKDILKKEAYQIIWREIEGFFDVPIKGNLKSPSRFKRKLKRIQQIQELEREF